MYTPMCPASNMLWVVDIKLPFICPNLLSTCQLLQVKYIFLNWQIFEERNELEGHTVADLCAGHPRHRHAYISTNHSLQITVVTDQHQPTPFFMLKYEGSIALCFVINVCNFILYLARLKERYSPLHFLNLNNTGSIKNIWWKHHYFVIV